MFFFAAGEAVIEITIGEDKFYPRDRHLLADVLAESFIGISSEPIGLAWPLPLSWSPVLVPWPWPCYPAHRDGRAQEIRQTDAGNGRWVLESQKKPGLLPVHQVSIASTLSPSNKMLPLVTT